MRALPLLLLIPAFAFAQADPATEWEPPPALSPGPVEPLPVPPPLPPPPVEGSEPPAQVEPPVPAVVELPPPPDPRRFSWGRFALALDGAFGTSSYFAVRLEAGVVYGRPQRMEGSLDHARGFTLGIGLEGLLGKIVVAACGIAGFCGSRYQAGLALRAAYNWGVIGQDGVVVPVHEVFFQAVPFVSTNGIPSAPLAPGNVWAEYGARLEVGLVSGYLRGSTWPRTRGPFIGGGLYFALGLEWLAINSDETGRFRFGLSVGVGI